VIYFTGRRQKYDIAERIIAKKCCSAGCLQRLDLDWAKEIVVGCIDEIDGLDRNEKHKYIFQKLYERTNGISAGGYLDCQYSLGAGLHYKAYGVCHTCFQNVYDISHTTLYNIRQEVKSGYTTNDIAEHTGDGSGRINAEKGESRRQNPAFVRELQAIMNRVGYKLDTLQIAAMCIPNTSASLTCFAWMQDHFDLVAENEPNQIAMTLDPIPYEEIYDEYLLDMGPVHEATVSMKTFRSIWNACFPHVHVREWIALSGHCSTCAALSEGRKTHKSREDRAQLRMLHELHRSGYMNERLHYYTRRGQALSSPSKYLSLITDGMMQQHCLLPWYGNVNQFGENLPQHLQGVLAHGRFMNIYRSYHNVFGGANRQIHTLLLALQQVLDTEGNIPDTVYIQVDGGSENSAKVMVGLCELLIAQGVCSKIVLSRLMVGHTHEDIDARFALIWRRIRAAFVLTMGQYEKAVKQSQKHSGLACDVVDMFVIPNYTKYISECMDSNFGRYAKRVADKDWSVLQFTMESVTDEKERPFFPLGVKTFWRPFAADNHIRIVRDSKALCGMTFDELGPIQNMPLPEGDIPGGMYLLQKIPESSLEPEPFVQGSRALLEEVTNKVMDSFQTSVGDTVRKEWLHFCDDIAPKSDSVVEYLAEHPMDVPLKDELFSGINIKHGLDIPARQRKSRNKECPRSRKSQVLDYVQWNRRGNKLDTKDPARHLPNIVVDGPDHLSYSTPVYCRDKKSHRLPHHDKQDVVTKPSQSSQKAEVEKAKSYKPTSDTESGSDAKSCSDSEEYASTDSELDGFGWLTCKKNHYIRPNYGFPLTLIGKTFTVIPKYGCKAKFAEKCSQGKIAYVVRHGATDDNREGEDLYFKCYNHTTNTSEPHPGSDEWVYVKCKDFMSSDVKRRMMTWDPDPSIKPSRRSKRQKRSTWAYEVEKKALYDTTDDDENLDKLPYYSSRRPRKKKLPKAEDVFSDNTIPKDSIPAVEKYRNQLRAKLHDRLSSIRSEHAERQKKQLSPPLTKETKESSLPHVEEVRDYGVQSEYVDHQRGYVELSDSEDSYDDDFESESGEDET